MRGGEGFWDDYERAHEGGPGARAATRRQYLRHVEGLLDASSHLTAWAVAHVEDGFVSTDELVETIRHRRRVGTIYTKNSTS